MAIETSPSAGLVKIGPGVVIDKKYKVLSLLGEGGMGAVYRVHHLDLDKEVALKTFRTQNFSDDSWKRFQREAQAIGRLNHKNIVQVYDFGFSEQRIPFYTMECLSGRSLDDMLVTGDRPGLERTLQIFIEVCQALTTAHKKGIIHRDIKPANIFLAQDILQDKTLETVKVVDFGIAGLAADNIEAPHGSSSVSWDAVTSQRLTTAGTIFGSPLYMSPEQVSAEQIGPQSDIYSTGCSLFEALTGSPPYKGESAFSTMIMHQKTPIPSLSERYEGKLPQRLEPLITKMLAKNPVARPQSFAQVEQELQEILNALRLAAQTETQATQAAQAQNNAKINDTTRSAASKTNNARAQKLAIALSIGLILAGGCGYYFWKNQSTEHAKSSEKRSINSQVNTGSDQVRSKAAALESEQPAKPFYIGSAGSENIYNFPTKSIGTITWSNQAGYRNCLGEVEAAGEVSIPAVRRGFNFYANQQVSDNPQLLDRFRDGDLRSLHLQVDYRFSNEHLHHIVHMVHLKNLDVGDQSMNDDSFNDIAALKHLDALDVKGANYSAAKLETLPVLNKLDSLMLSNTKKAMDIIKKMRGSKKLRVLDLTDCDLQDSDMELISSFPNLQELNLSDNTHVTNKGLAKLNTMPNLHKIDLSLTHTSPDAVAMLKTFPALNKIIVSVEGWPKERQKTAADQLPWINIHQEDTVHSYQSKSRAKDIEDFFGKSSLPDANF